MHELVRPGGELLDLHPQPHPYRKVEVRIHERLVEVGRLYRESYFLVDIEAARKSLAATIAEGLYEAEEESEFEYAEHYDAAESFRTCLAKPRVAELVADDRLIESACSLMPAGEGEIIVTQMERAARLRRLP